MPENCLYAETRLSALNHEKVGKCAPRLRFQLTFIVLHEHTNMYPINIFAALATHLYEARSGYGDY